MRTRSIIPWLLLLLAWAAPAWAEGPQFTGTCNLISWQANTELDLDGYKIYDRVSLSVEPTPIATVGLQITSVTCASLGFNPGQHYISVSSLDTTGNESARSTEFAFTIVVDNQVSDLRVTIINATDMTLTWTEVNDGAGAPANYDVRLATPTIEWGSAASVSSGTCSTPVAGTTIGASKSCTVTGLSTTTPYQFQLIPFRGTLGANPAFGPLSNIASGTTGSAPPSTTRVTLWSDFFTRANGALGLLWDGGYTDNVEFQITSNAVRCTLVTTNLCTERYNGVAMPANQWVQGTIKTLSATGSELAFVWVAARCTGPPTYTCYQATAANNFGSWKTAIEKKVNGVQTILMSEGSTNWVSTDTIAIETIDVQTGVEIKVYRNGSGSALLSTIDTGSPITLGGWGGIGAFVYLGTVGQAELEDVQGGGFTTTPVAETCGCDNH